MQVGIQLDKESSLSIHVFHPIAERTYYLSDLLTIENLSGIRSMKVSEWLREDPVAFDITRKENKLKLHTDVFDVLISKLKVHHPDYFKEVLGLKTRIKFKGYDKLVQASVPYSTQPIEFYKWWCSNQDIVNMTLQEKIKLFDKVYSLNQTVLKRKHKLLINKE